LFQNPVGFGTTSWKSGQMPAFPLKSNVAVPKTEVLEQPQLYHVFILTYPSENRQEKFRIPGAFPKN
jgi:hypothetical protein